MKWHERHGPTIELALIALVGVAMLALMLMIIFIPFKSYGASCLTIDVPPQVVIGVMDGDTFSVFNLLPPGYVKVRVKDINTPERGRPGFDEARLFTADWLAKGTFKLETCGKHTFERIEGVVTRNGATLAEALQVAGHAR